MRIRRITLVLAPWVMALALMGCKKEQATTETAPAAGKPAAEPAKPAGLGAETLPGAWESDVRDNLLKLVAEYGQGGTKHDPARPPVVTFDFDNTCVRGDIGRAFYDWMIQERKIKFDDKIFAALPDDLRQDIRTAVDELGKVAPDKQTGSPQLQKLRKLMHKAYWSLCHSEAPEKCFPWQVRYYAGYTPQEVIDLAAQVMDAEMKKPLGSEPIKAGEDDEAPAITATGIRVHGEIRSLIHLLQGKGFQVWIVTAGPQWVVAGAARPLGVDASHVLGMRTVLADGRLTTEMDTPPTFREGKVKAIERFIGQKPVLALGDSWTDAEMLGYAEHGLLIDRGYADLKKKAQESGWWVQPEFPVK